jgi:hypothetical protein
MRKSMAQPARKRGAAPQGIELVLAAAEGRSWPGVSGRQKKGAHPLRCSTTTHRSILGRCPLGDRLSHNRHAIRWFVAGLVQKAAAFSGVRVIRSAVACFGSFFSPQRKDRATTFLPQITPRCRSILDQRRGSIYPSLTRP